MLKTNTRILEKNFTDGNVAFSFEASTLSSIEYVSLYITVGK